MEDTVKLTLRQALIPVMVMVAAIACTTFILDVKLQYAITASIIFTLWWTKFKGFAMQQLGRIMGKGIVRAKDISLNMLLIGGLIGCWMVSGVVPYFIYHGVQLINSQSFLVVAFLLSSVVSMIVGSSNGTASTVGIALLSIGLSLKVPLPLIVGAVVSGSYLGNRTSPMSPLANVTAAAAESDTIQTTKYLFTTLIPATLLTTAIYAWFGFTRVGTGPSVAEIERLLGALAGNFNLTHSLLLLPLLIIIFSIKGMSIHRNIAINIVLSCLLGMLLQAKSFVVFLLAIWHGYYVQTGYDILDLLLCKGGVVSMFDIVSTLILAFVLANLWEQTGVLKTVIGAFFRGNTTPRQLVVRTMGAGLLTTALACSQTLAILLPGKALLPLYHAQKVHPLTLARSLGDSGVVLAPLIPWNVNGLLMTGIFAVPTLTYTPYAFFCYLTPLCSLVFCFCGLFKMAEDVVPAGRQIVNES